TSKFSTLHTYNSTSHTYNIHITRKISPCAMYIVRVGCKKCTCHQMYVLQDFLFFSVLLLSNKQNPRFNTRLCIESLKQQMHLVKHAAQLNWSTKPIMQDLPRLMCT